MIDVHVDDSWRVRLRAEFIVPAEQKTVWKIIADFERFVCADHFHKRIEYTHGSGGVGSQFTLLHSLFGVRVIRTGRILQWREGTSYAYSDLSRDDSQTGFPHVFFVDLQDSPMGCKVRVRVNGRWTTTWLGHMLTRLWLHWNLITIRQGFENAILRTLLADRRLRKGTTGSSSNKTQNMS